MNQKKFSKRTKNAKVASRSKAVVVQQRASKATKGTFLGKLGRNVGSLFGPVGTTLGGAAGDLISKITGWGDYKIGSNSISDGRSVPSFRSEGDGVRVCHREFISDVTGSTAFTNSNFNINPGLSQTFPWLSQLAENFEEYRMNGLVFEYRPTSGSAVATNSSALGVVVMATDYNAAAPNFTSKQMMESYEFSSSTVPFNSALHPVECKPLSNTQNSYYIRSGDATVTNQQLFDMGNFQLATSGMQSAYVVGELWVTYDVSLLKPRISTNMSQNDYCHLNEAPAGSATAAHPLGTTGGYVFSSSTLTGVGASLTNPTTSINFPNPGAYYVSFNWHNGNGTLAAVATVTPGSNIKNGGQTTASILIDQSTFAASCLSADGTSSSWTGIFTVTAAGTGTANDLVITGLTSMTASKFDAMIFGLPNNLGS